MGIGTLRRHHDATAAFDEGVAVAEHEKTAETQNNPAKALNAAGAGSGIAKAKKIAPKAGATPGNGGSE